MNNTPLNGLVLYRSKWFSDLVDENMLSQALLTRPAEISTVLSYVFGTYENNTLDFLTNGIGKTITVENREYKWPLMIDQDKAIVIQDAKWQGAAVTSTSTPGINGSPVQVAVNEKWLALA